MCTFCSVCANQDFLVTTMTAPLFRLSSVSMATSMEIAFDHSFCVRSCLLGSQGGASLFKASPDLMDHWNQYAKLGPSTSFQQTTIKHHCIREKYTSTSHKGPMWFFPVLGFALDVEQSSVVSRTRGSTMYHIT